MHPLYGSREIASSLNKDAHLIIPAEGSMQQQSKLKLRKERRDKEGEIETEDRSKM